MPAGLSSQMRAVAVEVQEGFSKANGQNLCKGCESRKGEGYVQ
jgi:hypothetical protein